MGKIVGRVPSDPFVVPAARRLAGGKIRPIFAILELPVIPKLRAKHLLTGGLLVRIQPEEPIFSMS